MYSNLLLHYSLVVDLVSIDKHKPYKQVCGGQYYASANDGQMCFHHTEDVFPLQTCHLYYTHPPPVLHK